MNAHDAAEAVIDSLLFADVDPTLAADFDAIECEAMIAFWEARKAGRAVSAAQRARQEAVTAVLEKIDNDQKKKLT